MVTIVATFLLCGCNYKILDTDWQFDYAYITLPDGCIREVKIDKWSEDGNSVTIRSKDGNVYCVSMHNCFMTKERWTYGEDYDKHHQDEYYTEEE